MLYAMLFLTACHSGSVVLSCSMLPLFFADKVVHARAKDFFWKKLLSKPVSSAYHKNPRGFENLCGRFSFFDSGMCDVICNSHMQAVLGQFGA